MAVFVLLGLLAMVYFWTDNVRHWVRDPRNSTELNSHAAAAQVIFAAVLAFLTWRANRTALSVAATATEDVLLARRQAEQGMLPQMTVNRYEAAADGPFWLDLYVMNIGLGSAVELTAEAAGAAAQRKQPAAGVTFAAGMSSPNSVALPREHCVIRIDQLANKDALPRYTLTVLLRYSSISGNRYETAIRIRVVNRAIPYGGITSSTPRPLSPDELQSRAADDDASERE
jgi:hypothetical protein